MHNAALFGPAILALGLAAWGGVRVWLAASVGADTEPGLAIALCASLFLSLWGWRRARQGGPDAPRPGTVDALWVECAPFIVVLTAALLLAILPRVLWPTAEGIRFAGSIASTTVMAGLIVIQVGRIVVGIRRRRAAESSR